MANGRIDVYFHDGSSAEVQQDELTESNAPDGKKKASSSKFDKSAIMSGIVSYSKKAMGEAVQVFGDLTGDYQTQRQIDGTIQAIGTAVMMANFPIGTIAGAFSLTTQAINQVVKNIQSNRESAMLLKRSGNETTNESEI